MYKLLFNVLKYIINENKAWINLVIVLWAHFYESKKGEFA
jgi:hypothetical protein